MFNNSKQAVEFCVMACGGALQGAGKLLDVVKEFDFYESHNPLNITNAAIDIKTHLFEFNVYDRLLMVAYVIEDIEGAFNKVEFPSDYMTRTEKETMMHINHCFIFLEKRLIKTGYIKRKRKRKMSNVIKFAA